MVISRILRLVFDRTNKTKNKDDTALIQYRIRWKGKTKYVTTGYHVKKSQWDENTQTVKDHPEQDEINSKFIKKRKNLKALLFEDEDKSIDQLINFIKGTTSSLVEYLENYIDSIRPTHRIGTIKNYENTLSKLKEFQKKKKSNFYLKEVDRTLIRDFQTFLLNYPVTRGSANKTLKPISVSNHIDRLKTALGVAIDDEMIKKDPFKKYKRLQIGKNDFKKAPALSDNDLKLLENFILPKKINRYQKYLDLFLFSCYTFLPFVDLKTLKVSHIKKEEDLIKIVKPRVKSDRFGKEFYLPLSKMPTGGKAIEILKKWSKGKKQNDLIFPFMRWVGGYNGILKNIALASGISVIPTSHSGRQTCVQWYKLHTDLSNDLIGSMSCQSPKVVAKYAGDDKKRLENVLDRMFK